MLGQTGSPRARTPRSTAAAACAQAAAHEEPGLRAWRRAPVSAARGAHAGCCFLLLSEVGSSPAPHAHASLRVMSRLRRGCRRLHSKEQHESECDRSAPGDPPAALAAAAAASGAMAGAAAGAAAAGAAAAGAAASPACGAAAGACAQRPADALN